MKTVQEKMTGGPLRILRPSPREVVYSIFCFVGFLAIMYFALLGGDLFSSVSKSTDQPHSQAQNRHEGSVDISGETFGFEVVPSIREWRGDSREYTFTIFLVQRDPSSRKLNESITVSGYARNSTVSFQTVCFKNYLASEEVTENSSPVCYRRQPGDPTYEWQGEPPVSSPASPEALERINQVLVGAQQALGDFEKNFSGQK